MTASETAGGVGHDEVTLRIAQNAGPFLVDVVRQGRQRQGRDVQGHRVEGQRHQAAGREGPHPAVDRRRQDLEPTLATATPNDGKAKVRIPKVKTKKARIMIAANGNYFFDVNDKNFKIW